MSRHLVFTATDVIGFTFAPRWFGFPFPPHWFVKTSKFIREFHRFMVKILVRLRLYWLCNSSGFGSLTVTACSNVFENKVNIHAWRLM